MTLSGKSAAVARSGSAGIQHRMRASFRRIRSALTGTSPAMHMSIMLSLEICSSCHSPTIDSAAVKIDRESPITL